ncbi:MAG TPA: hypothetical protein VHO70_11370 [Chitinispirillaceae bacterium]|nr:hypothetical protein [Chitinispirillaceae bacterium]
MLRFATRPDDVFTELLDAALSFARDTLDNIGPDLNFHWLDENTWKLFGQSTVILNNELVKLIEANKSSELYQPTDYHFRLIDKVLDWYCDLYNDWIQDDTGCAIYYKDTTIPHFSIYSIRTDFFWDMDFDLFEVLGGDRSENAQAILQIMGVSQSGMNMQQGKSPDLSEFTLKKCEPDPDWNTVEDYGDDFWFENQNDEIDEHEFDD